jgi:carbamate kinase
MISDIFPTIRNQVHIAQLIAQFIPFEFQENWGIKHMTDTVVILINGEVLAGSYESTIKEQKSSADILAESLLPILSSDLKIAITHGNKPQVGYVLFRSEVASHILHPIPLDVCGADTQGATGYMLSQSILNVLRKHKPNRHVMSVITQTVVNSDNKYQKEPNKQIGPWLDRDRAKQRRQLYGWDIVEEPGHGFRRIVSSPPPIEIVETEGIKQLVESGTVVITAGGGGVPVVYNEHGALEGVEAVVDTDLVACMLAHQLNANILLMIIENDNKFISSGIGTEVYQHLSLGDLIKILTSNTIQSNMVRRKINSAVEFLEGGGQQVVITTLQKLGSTLSKESGLWIGADKPSLDISIYTK